MALPEQKKKRKSWIYTSIVLFAFGIIWFGVGFHTIDSSVNMRIINHATGMTFSDCSAMDVCYDPDSAYKLGLSEIFAGFLLFGLGCFLLSHEITILKHDY